MTAETPQPSEPLAGLRALDGLCAEKVFAPGEVIRTKGHYYRDMFVVLDGEVAVDLDPGNEAIRPFVLGGVSPIGEIGFLRGTAATATVSAQSRTRAVVLDDASFTRIEHERPDLFVQLLQGLARIAEDRTSYNVTLADDGAMRNRQQDGEVLLCRNREMLRQAQKLRYDVYCRELGRTSPTADHDAGILEDELDRSGHTFVAVHDGRVVGTLRTNFPSESPIGALEHLYGMRGSPHHPQASAICTKFIVERSMRRSQTAMRLVSRLAQYGEQRQIKECYIDSIPQIVHHYHALGFRVCGNAFFHPENGPSLPMRIDLTRFGRALGAEVTPLRLAKVYVLAKTHKLARRIGSALAREKTDGNQ